MSDILIMESHQFCQEENQFGWQTNFKNIKILNRVDTNGEKMLDHIKRLKG